MPDKDDTCPRDVFGYCVIALYGGCPHDEESGGFMCGLKTGAAKQRAWNKIVDDVKAGKEHGPLGPMNPLALRDLLTDVRAATSLKETPDG